MQIHPIGTIFGKFHRKVVIAYDERGLPSCPYKAMSLDGTPNGYAQSFSESEITDSLRPEFEIRVGSDFPYEGAMWRVIGKGITRDWIGYKLSTPTTNGDTALDTIDGLRAKTFTTAQITAAVLAARQQSAPEAPAIPTPEHRIGDVRYSSSNQRHIITDMRLNDGHWQYKTHKGGNGWMTCTGWTAKPREACASATIDEARGTVTISDAPVEASYTPPEQHIQGQCMCYGVIDEAHDVPPVMSGKAKDGIASLRAKGGIAEASYTPPEQPAKCKKPCYVTVEGVKHEITGLVLDEKDHKIPIAVQWDGSPYKPGCWVSLDGNMNLWTAYTLAISITPADMRRACKRYGVEYPGPAKEPKRGKVWGKESHDEYEIETISHTAEGYRITFVGGYPFTTGFTRKYISTGGQFRTTPKQLNRALKRQAWQDKQEGK